MGPRQEEARSGLLWTVLEDGARSGAENMARDHALAMVRAGPSATLRLYRWAVPTVSFGRNQPAEGIYSREAAQALGIEFVRRPTGGRAVLHHEELTYSVVAPLRAWGGLRQAFGGIHAGIVLALQSLGLPARLSAGGGGGRRPDAEACFREPAPGEIEVRGRKLVGSAQVRIRESFLQHGSILLDGDQELLGALGPPGLRGRPAVTVREVLRRVPSDAELMRALRQGLAEALGGSWDGVRHPLEIESMSRDLLRLYRSQEWTWRR